MHYIKKCLDNLLWVLFISENGFIIQPVAPFQLCCVEIRHEVQRKPAATLFTIFTDENDIQVFALFLMQGYFSNNCNFTHLIILNSELSYFETTCFNFEHIVDLFDKIMWEEKLYENTAH